MKNKKFSQLLHRLPVLLLALIITVSPLMMAVPAKADVLVGASGSLIELGIINIDGEALGYALSNFNIPLYRSQAVIFYSQQDGYLLGMGAYVFSNPIEGDAFHVSVMRGYLWPLTEVCETEIDGVWYQVFDVGAGEYGDHYYDAPVVILFGDATGETGIPIGSLTLQQIGGGPGVLSVFSGVGSWLSGAIQSATTMFWTAESGMTVLGYLAVASLALAVILLIFSLIAGWLKFH